jgi:hypothetical protein
MGNDEDRDRAQAWLDWYWAGPKSPEAILAKLAEFRAEARRAGAFAVAADPRGVCPGCGELALDGKATCGRAQCGSSTGQPRPLEVLLADAVALPPPVSLTLKVEGRPIRMDIAFAKLPNELARVRHVTLRSPAGETLYQSGDHGIVADVWALEALVRRAAAKLEVTERLRRDALRDFEPGNDSPVVGPAFAGNPGADPQRLAERALEWADELSRRAGGFRRAPIGGAFGSEAALAQIDLTEAGMLAAHLRMVAAALSPKSAIRGKSADQILVDEPHKPGEP